MGAAGIKAASTPLAVAVDPAGDILVADTASNRIRKIGA